MAQTLKLTILSPERRVVSSVDVNSVLLPTWEGEVEVLPGHTAFVGLLRTGRFSYVDAHGGDSKQGVISSGFFEVLNDEVSVLAETIELKEEIDLQRARAAQKKAEEILTGPDLTPSNFRKYELKLHRALVRQQVASKHVEN